MFSKCIGRHGVARCKIRLCKLQREADKQGQFAERFFPGELEAVANQRPTTGESVVTFHQFSKREWQKSKSRSLC